MTGSVAQQVALLFMHARYVRAERLSGWFPEVKPLWQAADKAHDDMLRAALACGFDPGGEHRHLSTEQWAEKRCELIKAHLSAHVDEAQRRAA